MLSLRKKMILIADDDKDIVEFVLYNLKKADIECYAVNDGLDALRFIETQNPKIALLDISMSNMDGIEISRTLREKGINTYIIIFSARHEDYIKIAAYDSGCNDFITKPIHPKLLVKKIDSILNWYKQSEKQTKRVSYKGFDIDPVKRTVSQNGVRFILSKKQFDILYLLSYNIGVVFTREEIYDKIWNTKYEKGNRTIDVHIMGIKKILKNDIIKSLKGVGYKCEE